MKTKIYFIFFLSLLLASCSSLQQSTINDDIYYSPKDELVASNDVNTNPTYDKNKSTDFSNKYDKAISDVLKDTTKTVDTLIYEDKYENPYDRVVVDSYDEAYQRRLDAMQSPYYGMYNNYFIAFSDDYWYAQSYFNDPFYNVVIIGDQVWVEPSWISSSFGYWPSWRYNYNPYYYSSYYNPYYYGSYYNPYYYGSYGYPYYGYYSYYKPYHNDNYVGSSFHSYRQRSLAGISGTRSTFGSSSRGLPETYMGRGIRSSSTVKSGIDRQTSQTVRSGEGRSRPGENNIAPETIRVRETNNTRTGTSSRTYGREGQSGTSRSYTRPQQTTRSTYSSPSRSTTRYNRPESTRTGSRSSYSGGNSTYSSPKSGSSRSGSSSTYTPRRSSVSSGSSSVRTSSGSSGSVRSSSGSSGSSTRSSGSSTRSGSSRSRR